MQEGRGLESVPVFHNPEIEALFRPILELLHKMKEQIESCEYSYIIGDDASGRIPALVFWNVLKRIYKDKGVDGPALYFIAGSGPRCRHDPRKQEKIDKLKEYIGPFFENVDSEEKGYVISDEILRGLHRNLVGKVLIVTEIVSSGNSLSPLVQVLHHSHVECDVVTTQINSVLPDAVREVEGNLGCKVFYPDRDSTSAVYKRRSLSGVTKSVHDVLSTKHMSPDIEEGSVVRAREDVKLVSDLIYKSMLTSADLSTGDGIRN